MVYPTAIITSDIEIRDYAPQCRLDDYYAAMARKLRFIRRLQHRYGGIPVLDGGDLFDKRYRSHPAYPVLPFARKHLPDPFITIPGNHDLPQHEIANYPRSAMAVLEEFGRIQVARPETPLEVNDLRIWGFPYRLPHNPPDVERIKGKYNVALVHAMVYQVKEPYPGAKAEGEPTRKLIRLFKNFDLIVCGHNHQSFVEDYKGRILVNPGSLMRADANQAEYKPRVFLWYAEAKRLRAIMVPVEEGVVSKDHIEKRNTLDRRLDAFVEALAKDSDEETVSFRSNLYRTLSDNHVPKDVKTKVTSYYES